MRVFCGTKRQNDTTAVGSERVRMRLIEIDYDPSYKRFGAVLAGANPENAIHIYRDVLCVVSADYAGKVKQDPVWIFSRLNRWRHGSTELDFDAQAAALSCRADTLY